MLDLIALIIKISVVISLFMHLGFWAVFIVPVVLLVL